ncbi:MAG: FAD-dependent oxidoreductase [Pseudomonadota bacterium]
MARVLVVGGGPAGLAAAERLLDLGQGRIELTLLNERAYLGGKAASWELADGRVLENGQHITMGFYRELPALLARAGVDHRATSVSNGGHFTIWEDRDRRAHHLHLGPSTLGTLVDGLRYTGWTLREKIGFAALLVRLAPRVLAGVPEDWDDLCLTALCTEQGLPASIFATNAFRATRDAQLNWPGEISAYAMLKTIQRAGRDYLTSEARFPAGGMSRLWWEPVARRIEALGGTIQRGRRLVALEGEGHRLRGLLVGAADCPAHDDEPCHAADVVAMRDFDAVILAIPPAALAVVLARSPGLEAHPALAGCARLRPVAPLGLHVWHRRMAHPEHRTVVLGLPPPLEFCVDNKPNYAEYRDDPRFGACLHFVGQETGFEGLEGPALLDLAMAGLRRVRGYEHLDDAGILDWRVVRNRLPHQRYWNAEPGSLRHKPWPKGPLEGLWLAGDWIRSELDFPSMESAVHSGRTTAEAVLAAL